IPQLQPRLHGHLLAAGRQRGDEPDLRRCLRPFPGAAHRLRRARIYLDPAADVADGRDLRSPQILAGHQAQAVGIRQGPHQVNHPAAGLPRGQDRVVSRSGVDGVGEDPAVLVGLSALDLRRPALARQAPAQVRPGRGDVQERHRDLPPSGDGSRPRGSSPGALSCRRKSPSGLSPTWLKVASTLSPRSTRSPRASTSWYRSDDTVWVSTTSTAPSTRSRITAHTRAVRCARDVRGGAPSWTRPRPVMRSWCAIRNTSTALGTNGVSSWQPARLRSSRNGASAPTRCESSATTSW